MEGANSGRARHTSGGSKIATVTPKNESSRATDSDLLELSREGDCKAFGRLWSKHSATALATAREALATGVSHAQRDEEDLVSEAFERIITEIRSGDGPTYNFELYLHAVIADIARIWNTKALAHATVTEAITVLEHPADLSLRSEYSRATVEAFTSLPDRWRTVLWHTEVDNLPTAEVADLMNLTTNNAAVLAFRARAGLRKRWQEKTSGSMLGDDRAAASTGGSAYRSVSV
jgi:RNA polymerase sigma factor (sigma-70 family)